MPGKKKCRILREIRQKIAEENDIPFVTEECRYKGDCKGTCPRCESELRYLEQQLEQRRSLGKKVTVGALALGMAVSVAGCRQISGDYLEGDVPYVEPETEVVSTAGSIAESEPLQGKIAPETDPSEDADPSEGEYVLEGDGLYEPESGFDPAENLTPTVYGPPATTAADSDG